LSMREIFLRHMVRGIRLCLLQSKGIAVDSVILRSELAKEKWG